MEKHRVLIGMSGGVDSSVAALLMQREGFCCAGGTMLLHGDGCGGSQDVLDARAVAQRLGMDFYEFDLRETFDRQVVQYFVQCYEQGETPNPCIRCNRHLKFGALLDAAQELGCQDVVTGHYARIRQDSSTGRYLLYKAADPAKDQSYFLASLSQQQLSHIRFPLGELTKEQVRSIAQEHGLINARKRDSQDICFVPDGDYAAFLRRYTVKDYAPGNFLDLDGNVVGTHRGTVCYTLGQRKGLGLAMGAPVYVTAKDMVHNTVTVGPNEALFSTGLVAKDWNWHPFPALTEPMDVTARIRHSQLDLPARVHPMEDGLARVEFHNPQRAVTPGQAVVLYQGDLVIGGGTIVSAF